MNKNCFVLLTGLMSAGKSTILREYMLNFKTIEFTRPPVEAKFQGKDFEFLDSIFAIRNRADQKVYNFYELDAPTVKKWIQFISIADGIIVVANINQKIQYSKPKALLDVILENAPNTPILFVIGNYDDYDAAKQKVIEDYRTDRVKPDNLEFIALGKGKEYFDDVYGKRIQFDNNVLKSIFEYHFSSKNDRI